MRRGFALQCFHYEISEDFAGLIQLSNTTAETIHRSLNVSLMSLGLEFENCRGLAYDGANNFRGHVSGVGKRFQDKNPAAIPVHCLAHSVNLCLQEVARKVTSIMDGLDFAMDSLFNCPKTSGYNLKMYKLSEIPYPTLLFDLYVPHGGLSVLEPWKLLWQTMEFYSLRWKCHLMALMIAEDVQVEC